MRRLAVVLTMVLLASAPQASAGLCSSALSECVNFLGRCLTTPGEKALRWFYLSGIEQAAGQPISELTDDAILEIFTKQIQVWSPVLTQAQATGQAKLVLVESGLAFARSSESGFRSLRLPLNSRVVSYEDTSGNQRTGLWSGEGARCRRYLWVLRRLHDNDNEVLEALDLVDELLSHPTMERKGLANWLQNTLAVRSRTRFDLLESLGELKALRLYLSANPIATDNSSYIYWVLANEVHVLRTDTLRPSFDFSAVRVSPGKREVVGHFEIKARQRFFGPEDIHAAIKETRHKLGTAEARVTLIVQVPWSTTPIERKRGDKIITLFPSGDQHMRAVQGSFEKALPNLFDQVEESLRSLDPDSRELMPLREIIIQAPTGRALVVFTRYDRTWARNDDLLGRLYNPQ